jgi:hypothetical protein
MKSIYPRTTCQNLHLSSKKEYILPSAKILLFFKPKIKITKNTKLAISKNILVKEIMSTIKTLVS